MTTDEGVIEPHPHQDNRKEEAMVKYKSQGDADASGNQGEDEVLFLMQGRDKRKRSPSPRRRRQRPKNTRETMARDSRDQRHERGRREGSCEDEWEWDEDARRYFRREWRSRERTSTSSWARIPPWRHRAHRRGRQRRRHPHPGRQQG